MRDSLTIAFEVALIAYVVGLLVMLVSGFGGLM